MSEETLFDLAVNRTIQLHDRGRTFLAICSAPSREDWLAYFKAISITVEVRDGQRVTTSDFETPLIALAEATLIDCAGYKLADGVNLKILPDWPKRIPLAHRRQIGLVLSDVRPTQIDGDDLIIPLDGEEVLLDATFGQVDGKMVKMSGLKHKLHTPTAAHLKRYNDATSKSVVVGGSRTGKTMYPNAGPVMCELYDQLIAGVEGYAFEGISLTGRDPKAIAESMDLRHKLAVMQELLQPASTVSTEAEAE